MLSIAVPGAWTVGALAAMARDGSTRHDPYLQLVAVIGATLLGRVGLHSLGPAGLALTHGNVAPAS